MHLTRLDRRAAAVLGTVAVVAGSVAALLPRESAASTHLVAGSVQTSRVVTTHLSTKARATAHSKALEQRVRPGRRSGGPARVSTSSTSGARFRNVDAATAATSSTATTTPKVGALPGTARVEQLFGASGLTHDEQVNLFGTDATPPDTQVGASTTQVVEALNTVMLVMDRSGANAKAYDLNAAWSPAETLAAADHPVQGSGLLVSDPRIVFDTQSNHWIMSILIYDEAFVDPNATAGQLAASYSYIAEAVSPGTDPTVWNEMVMPGAAGQLDDQPGLGTADDKIMASSNNYDFSQNGQPFVGAQIWVVNKDELVTAAATVHFDATASDPTPYSFTPAIARSSTTTGYVAWNTSVNNGSDVDVVAVTGVPSASTTPTYTSHGLPMGYTTSPPPAIAQPGTQAQVDAGDDRFESAVWQNGALFVGGNTGIVYQNLPPQSALFLVRVNTGPMQVDVNFPQIFFSGIGTSFAYPGIALDSDGDPFLAFSRGSSSVYMSGGTLSLDGADQLLSAGILNGAGGTNFYDESGSGSGVSRWGDYSGAAADPTDPTNVWVATEFAADTPSNHFNWGTSLNRVTISPPNVSGLSVASGRTSGFTSVQITGSNFDSASTGVLFGGVPALSVQWQDEHHVMAVSPPHSAGAVDVQVTSGNGGSPGVGGDVFTYVYPPISTGYWMTASDGGLFPFGDARNHSYGALGNVHLNAPIVGMVPTPDGGGYWMVARDGGVFRFGNAGGYGSTGNLRLNAPIVGMARTQSGRGYWLVASDGGIFPFGDAVYHSYGSTGNIRLNKPIIGMLPTATGNGYYLYAGDGGLFPFGDAVYHSYGSTGNVALNKPIVGMALMSGGYGYWLVASDGGMFPYGEAKYHSYGSTGNVRLNKPIIGMADTGDDQGYWLVASDGGLFPFGDGISHSYGSTGNVRLNFPIVAFAALPA